MRKLVEVNDTFESEGEKFKVIESQEITCDGCHFKENCHEFDFDALPSCLGCFRKDGKYVIFKLANIN